MKENKTILVIVALVIVAIGGYLLIRNSNEETTNENGVVSGPAAAPTDPNALVNKNWQWEKTAYQGEEAVYSDPEQYTIWYKTDGTYSAKIDCNNGSGSYTADNKGNIKMEQLITTLAQCDEDSRYDIMLGMFEAVQSYRIEENGEVLVLVWPAAGPVEYFRNAGAIEPEEVEGDVEEETEVDIDPSNTTYTIEGQEVTLIDGEATEEIPGSATTIDTKVWSTTEGDLNADELDDAAVILVQTPGGSGTFYYVAASINEDGKWVGTNSILLGDRIAMQTVEIEDGVIVVNYTDREEGAAMTDQPSVGVTRRFVVEGLTLVELDK